jgi:DNA-binding IclR family transcriptional regulator
VSALVAREETRHRESAASSTAVAQIGPLGKPVGAVTAAPSVLGSLHATSRPLNASEVTRAAGLHRGTAYNILRTLQTEGFVGYDETTRTYAVSILELAYGALRRSGLIEITRPLMHAVADAHGVSVYLSKVLAPSSMLLLDWVAGSHPDLHVTVARPNPSPAGASGIVIGAFGNSSEAEPEALLAQAEWYEKPSFPDFLSQVREAKQVGFAVDRGTIFRNVMLMSALVLSRSWELLLTLTAAGHSHDPDDKAVAALSRGLVSAARLSDSLPLLR